MGMVQVTPAGLQVRLNVQRPAIHATSLAPTLRTSQLLAKHSPALQKGAALPIGMDKQLQQSAMSWHSLDVVHSGYPPDDPPAPPVLMPPALVPPVAGLPPVPVLPPAPASAVAHGPSDSLYTLARWRKQSLLYVCPSQPHTGGPGAQETPPRSTQFPYTSAAPALQSPAGMSQKSPFAPQLMPPQVLPVPPASGGPPPAPVVAPAPVFPPATPPPVPPTAGVPPAPPPEPPMGTSG
jgi:hypothetical protein